MEVCEEAGKDEEAADETYGVAEERGCLVGY